MSDQSIDPAEEFKDIDLDNIETGFTEEDLEEVTEKVKGDQYEYSGVLCNVRKTEITSSDEPITKSQQKFWIVGVQVDWPQEVITRAQELFQSDIWSSDARSGWIEVRVGHERANSREDAEDEVEWLAEQVVMLENDPNIPV